MAKTAPRIGALRWPVEIVRIDQTPDAETGITETDNVVACVHADIQPTRASQFFGPVQVDTGITHQITIRFLDWLDNRHEIVRTTRLPDGAVRTERFRVWRVLDVDGRKRFQTLECELRITDAEA